LPPDSPAKLVSLTTDPDFDTPAVLEKYAGRFGADTNRWMFLTGTRKQIANVAAGSLKLSAVERKPVDQASPDDLFVHSTIFVIVDKHGHLRGVFETAGEGVDWQLEERKILAAVKQLEREE
jgi:protein SCO1/2